MLQGHTKKEETPGREQKWAVQYVLWHCHRFHTLFVCLFLFLSSGRRLSGEFDSLITGESKLDSTTAENHKGSSGVAGHSFIQAHYNVYQMDTTRHRVTSQDSRGRLPARLGEDESYEGDGRQVASNRDRSDQQLHGDEIKVVEACGVRHLVFLQTEASLAANAYGESCLPHTTASSQWKCYCLLNQQEVAKRYYCQCVQVFSFFSFGGWGGFLQVLKTQDKYMTKVLGWIQTRNSCLHGTHILDHQAARTPPVLSS